MLGDAFADGLIPSNPLEHLRRGERPRQTSKPKRILTQAEQVALVHGAPEASRALIATAVWTGLRIGELLGLVWGDVDLEAGTVTVRKQMSRKTKAQTTMRDRRVVPKTEKAVRVVPLMARLRAEFARHRLASLHTRPGDLVFGTGIGTPMSDRNAARRGLKPAVGAAGLDDPSLPPVTFHQLRRRAPRCHRPRCLAAVRLAAPRPCERGHHAADLHARVRDGRPGGAGDGPPRRGLRGHDFDACRRGLDQWHRAPEPVRRRLMGGLVREPWGRSRCAQQIAGQCASSGGAAVAVGPLALHDADEGFCFSVGLGSVGACADVPEWCARTALA